MWAKFLIQYDIIKLYDRIIKLHTQIHALWVQHENNLIFYRKYLLYDKTNKLYISHDSCG